MPTQQVFGATSSPKSSEKDRNFELRPSFDIFHLKPFDMASFVNFASRNFTKAVAAAGGAFAAFNASKYIGESNEGECGSGRSAYAKFPAANDFPDLTKHNNCMATHLTEKVYKKLRDLVRFKEIHNLANVKFKIL